jgi:hypothetical protein
MFSVGTMQLSFVPNHWYLFFATFEYIHSRMDLGIT